MNQIYASGGHLKAIGSRTIAGFSVVFTDQWSTDRQNEFFNARSDLDLEGRTSIRAIWHHGKDPELKASPLGRARFQLRPEGGLWAELALPANDTGTRIYELAEKGALAWSSGSSPHLVEREPVGTATWIKTWPVTEVSVCPASQAVEPRATIAALKSFYDTVIYSPLAGLLATTRASSVAGYYRRRAAEIYAGLIKSQLEMQMSELDRRGFYRS